MSVIVGFDTATPDLVAAATRDGTTVAERIVEPPAGARPAHASDLLAAVESLAEEAGGWPAVDLIAVGVGPGSFTGLRIGIATARALGQALGKPLAPVSTLAALAAGIDARGLRLPVLDARRGQVFAALYDDANDELRRPRVLAPQELAGEITALAQAPRAAGDGAVRFRRELEAAGADVLPDGAAPHRVSASQVCLLGAAASPLRWEAVRPIYLRPPDAELWRKRDRDREAAEGG